MKKKMLTLIAVMLLIFGGYSVYNFKIGEQKHITTNIVSISNDKKASRKVSTKKSVTKKAKSYTKAKKITKKAKKKTYKKVVIKKAKTYKTKKLVTKKTKNVDKAALQEYAKDLVLNTYNWSEADFDALVNLWNRESGWNPNSHNSKSGAHGIAQALPASKMKSEGKDYYTNGQTQIRWGLKYILNRYKTPSKAWKHFQKKGWY